MQYLTPSEIKKAAPAISRLPAKEDNLVDTTEFLAHLETLGYRTTEAIQGTPHVDAECATKGRHLAVASNRLGYAVAILNSHTIWRRAWLGYGWLSGTGFVLSATVPLPRWRGYEEPLTALLAQRAAGAMARTMLGGWTTTIHQRRWMARRFVSTAYLPGHKHPEAKELVVEGDWPADYVLGEMLSLVRRGGLTPENKRFNVRKLKPIQSPDAVWCAAIAAYQTGRAAMDKYKIE